MVLSVNKGLPVIGIGTQEGRRRMIEGFSGHFKFLGAYDARRGEINWCWKESEIRL